MIERPADDGGQRSRTADALDLWRAGERNVTRRTLSSDWRDDYQAAVDAALLHLQRYTTMAELVAAYWRRAQQLITAAASRCQRPD